MLNNFIDMVVGWVSCRLTPSPESDPMVKELRVLSKDLSDYTKESVHKIDMIIESLELADYNYYFVKYIEALTLSRRSFTYGTNIDGLILIASDNMRFNIGLPHSLPGMREKDIPSKVNEQFKELADMIFIRLPDSDEQYNTVRLLTCTINDKDRHYRIKRVKLFDNKSLLSGYVIIVDDVTKRIKHIRSIKESTDLDTCIKYAGKLEEILMEG